MMSEAEPLRLYVYNKQESCGVVQALDERDLPVFRALIRTPEKMSLAQAKRFLGETVFRINEGPPFTFVNHTSMCVLEEDTTLVVENFQVQEVKLPPEKDVFDPVKGSRILDTSFRWLDGYWEGMFNDWTCHLSCDEDGRWHAVAYLSSTPRITVSTDDGISDLDRYDPYKVLARLKERLWDGIRQETEWYVRRANAAIHRYELFTGQRFVLKE